MTRYPKERESTIKEVAQRLGVGQHSLYGWKKKFWQSSGDVDKDAEIRRLKKELARVTKACGILKSDRVLRQGCKVKHAFVAEHRQHFSGRLMCRCLRIHPSGFYAWLKAPLSLQAKEDARQTALIRKAWTDSGKVYGYRKLHDGLLDQGETVI